MQVYTVNTNKKMQFQLLGKLQALLWLWQQTVF